jgi:hypothetical protein
VRHPARIKATGKAARPAVGFSIFFPHNVADNFAANVSLDSHVSNGTNAEAAIAARRTKSDRTKYSWRTGATPPVGCGEGGGKNSRRKAFRALGEIGASDQWTVGAGLEPACGNPIEID